MSHLASRSAAFGRRLGAILGLAAFSSLALTAPAEAQRGRLIIGAEGLICSDFQSCDTAGAECPDSALPTDRCAAGPRGELVCTTTDTSARDYGCCNSDSDCMGTMCSRFGDYDFGVCVDMDARTLCGLADPAACFDHNGWAGGDCDGDGTPNSDDAEPCPARPDAGAADAGLIARGDAGADGGRDEPVDSGARDEDSGANAEKDAGETTAPSPAADYDYRGSGGCTCDSSGSGADATFFLFGIAIVLGRSLRRRES